LKNIGGRSGQAVLASTVAGSILGHGRHLSLGRQLSREKGCHPPNWAWQKPTGAQIKILPNRRPN